jgi:hypothetical protein
MKFDFTRGFPAAPFPMALSFLSAVVLAGAPLPCCSKKARNEETFASLTRKEEAGYWFGFPLIWKAHEGFVN